MSQKNSWKDSPIAILDTETTGLGPEARIIEMCVRTLDKRHSSSQLAATFNPGEIDWEHPDVIGAMAKNEIDRVQLCAKSTFAEMWLMFYTYISRCSFVLGHFVSFDMRMIEQECRRANLTLLPPMQQVDTIWLDWGFHPKQESYRLDEVAKRWNITVKQSHRAAGDVETCSEILLAMMPKLPDDTAEFLTACERWNQERSLWREERGAAKLADKQSGKP